MVSKLEQLCQRVGSDRVSPVIRSNLNLDDVKDLAAALLGELSQFDRWKLQAKVVSINLAACTGEPLFSKLCCLLAKEDDDALLDEF